MITKQKASGHASVKGVTGDFETVNAVWLEKNGVKVDWAVKETNNHWHNTYFTPRATHDHQAKGSCRLAWMVLDEMEERGWINPDSTTILDNMCGIGSFLIVAALKGYNTIGIELEKRFYEDMIGAEGFIDIDDDEDLFNGVNRGKQPGTISNFHSLTANVPSVGKIQVINGDARFADEIMYRVGEKFNDYWEGGLGVVCSPPYGNRLWDAGQSFGSKSDMTLAELSRLENETGRAQYSNDKDNIGTCRIAVINSPPYSRSTEHSDDQMDGFKDTPVTGHRGWLYSDRGNIAVLKLGDYDKEMLKVYCALYRTLSVGSPVALITRNFIQQGKVVTLDELTVKLMEEAGFTYQFTRRANLPDISFFKRINWEKMHRPKGLPLITWEEITFYRKER